MERVLVTGGAGFIGSAVVRRLVGRGMRVVTLDALTYAGHRSSLRDVADAANHRFIHGEIADQALVSRILAEERIEGVMHLAAESHVDRSIAAPAAFVATNVAGTVALLSATQEYWRGLSAVARRSFRFLHVSTDEVFGDLPDDTSQVNEASPYAPSSPYAASKAAADHFVRAWHRTHGLPVLLTHGSNTYGPYHYPEKLIPLAIVNALAGKEVSLFGSGTQRRDWLFVDDHAAALERVLIHGRVGQSYPLGGGQERSNRAVVEAICDLLDMRQPLPSGTPRRCLIRHVADRPGHDRRYALDTGKTERELGWRPGIAFEPGLARTVDWYLDNRWWWEPIRAGLPGSPSR